MLNASAHAAPKSVLSAGSELADGRDADTGAVAAAAAATAGDTTVGATTVGATGLDGVLVAAGAAGAAEPATAAL